MTSAGPVSASFPQVSAFLRGLHQDADIVFSSAEDFARSRLADSGLEGPALAAELERAATLARPDLMALWRKSGAELVPRGADEMRRFLLLSAAAVRQGS